MHKKNCPGSPGCPGFSNPYTHTRARARVVLKCLDTLDAVGNNRPGCPSSQGYLPLIAETSAAGTKNADSRRPCPGCVGGNIRKGGVGKALTTGGQPALSDCVAALTESQGLLFSTMFRDYLARIEGSLPSIFNCLGNFGNPRSALPFSILIRSIVWRMTAANFHKIIQ